MQIFGFLNYMGLLRMLNRSAFICNICFLFAILLLRMRNPVSPGLASLIIVMGFILSVVLNLIVHSWHLISRLRKRSLSAIPAPFIYLNAGFLLVQLILFIK